MTINLNQPSTTSNEQKITVGWMGIGDLRGRWSSLLRVLAAHGGVLINDGYLQTSKVRIIVLRLTYDLCDYHSIMYVCYIMIKICHIHNRNISY